MLEKYTYALFRKGTEMADEKNLILVDTKYEFGKADDTITLIDEIHTPDSSRYFYAEGFEERQETGERQKQLSKEFVREWLIANNFMGKEGQTVPEMSDEWVNTISQRYIELYEKVIGKKFVAEKLSDDETYKRIISSLNKYSASALLNSVLPTPVVPMKMKEPIGLLGSCNPARLLRTASLNA
jgi:phosphoribosylaminoimidazole-succinocarboxamide synthase